MSPAYWPFYDARAGRRAFVMLCQQFTLIGYDLTSEALVSNEMLRFLRFECDLKLQ